MGWRGVVMVRGGGEEGMGVWNWGVIPEGVVVVDFGVETVEAARDHGSIREREGEVLVLCLDLCLTRWT